MKKIIVLSLLVFACSATIPPRTYSQETLTGSGGSQFGIVGETLPNPLLVTVKDSTTGNPISGVTVDFIVDSLVVGSGVTDANGKASHVFTLGDTLGIYVVLAATDEDTVSFSLHALTLQETRKRLLMEIQSLADENIAFNAAQQSGVFKTVASKRKNKKIRIGKVPNQGQINELEELLDDNLDEMVVIASRIKFLIP